MPQDAQQVNMYDLCDHRERVFAGRIMDFVESGKLATDAVKFFVLDEADRLLDSDSQQLVMNLFSKLPKAATGTQRLQVC